MHRIDLINESIVALRWLRTGNVGAGLRPQRNSMRMTSSWCLVASILLAMVAGTAAAEPDSSAQLTNQAGGGVAVDGDVAVVGGDRAAYVYRWSGTSWVEEATLAPSGATIAFAGPVDVSGDVIVVGDYFRDRACGGDGWVTIYRWNGQSWQQEAEVTGDCVEVSDDFGSSVAVHEGVVVVGAPMDVPNGPKSGSAYVFRWDGTSWVREAKLTGKYVNGRYDEFGVSVAVDDDVVVVGAHGDENFASAWTGSAYVFRRDGLNWVEEAKLTASDGGANDVFGSGVTVDDGVVAVGAIGEDATYVFRIDEGAWVEETKLQGETSAGAHFGGPVRVSGDVLVVGAAQDGQVAAQAGSAHVYRWDGASWALDTTFLGSHPQHFLGGGIGADGDVVVISSAPSVYVYGFDGDGDGVDWVDNCPAHVNPDQANHDSDADGDLCDEDDDNDGRLDPDDVCPRGDLGWTSDSGSDHDGDGCRDAGEDADDDNDGVPDASDACSRGETGWTSNPASDLNTNGCRDASEDADADRDHIPDDVDACPTGETGWTSSSSVDFDRDGCLDSTEDLDDDNDGVPDGEDICPLDANCPPDPPSGLTARLMEGPGNIELTWAPSPNHAIEAYRVYRGTSASALDFHLEVGDVTRVVDRRVAYGVRLYYAVSAVTAGEGAMGTVADAIFIDATPPTIQVDWPQQPWVTASAAVPISESDVPTGLEVCSARVESGGLVTVATQRACQQPYLITVGNGAICRHEGVAACDVTLAAQDWVGNHAAATTALSIDYTPPATTRSLTGPEGRQGWWTGSVLVELACSDATSGCASTSVAVNGFASYSYQGPFRLRDDGVHEIAYSSEDAAGNLEAVLTASIPIDATPPVTDNSLRGTTGWADWWVSPVDVCFHPSDLTSGVAASHFIVDDGALETGSCVTLEEDGVHEVVYWSVDVAGNVEMAQSVQVKVDQQPPATTHTLTGSAGLRGWWVSEVEVGLSCFDATSGCAVSYLAVDAADPSEGSSFTFADGVHALAYHSVDVAGNEEVVQGLTLKVDSTPPEVTLVEPEEGHAYLEDHSIPNPTPQHTWVIGGKTLIVDAFDAMSGVERVEFWIDGGLRFVAMEEPFEWVWPAGSEEQGNHTVRVVGYDVAGNSAVAEREVLTLPTGIAPFLGPPSPLSPGWVEAVLLEQVVPLPGEGPALDEVPLDLLEVWGYADPDDSQFYVLHVRIAGVEPPFSPLRVLTIVPLPPVHVSLMDIPPVSVPLAEGSVALRVSFRYDPEQGSCPVSGGQTCLTPLVVNPLDTHWMLARWARAALLVESVVALEQFALPVVPVGTGPMLRGETVVVPFVGQGYKALDDSVV